MTNKLHLKKKIIKISILATIMFTHTGCFFGYFKNTLVPVKQPEQIVQHEYIEQPKEKIVITQTTSTPTSVNLNTFEPVVECRDDDATGCTKTPITSTELKEKVQAPTGGEIHKLQSIQGKNITIEERSNGFIFPQYKNKVVILEMFGKNCRYCIKEMPTLNKLRRKYRGKVEVIAVQVEDKMSASEAKYLIRKHKIHYPIIAGDTATNLQYNIQNTYGWTGILPFTMIVKDGITEFTYPGSVSYKEMRNNLRSILR